MGRTRPFCGAGAVSPRGGVDFVGLSLVRSGLAELDFVGLDLVEPGEWRNDWRLAPPRRRLRLSEPRVVAVSNSPSPIRTTASFSG